MAAHCQTSKDCLFTAYEDMNIYGGNMIEMESVFAYAVHINDSSSKLQESRFFFLNCLLWEKRIKIFGETSKGIYALATVFQLLK